MIKIKNKLMLIQCSALIMSLSAVFIGTYAWYTANRSTSLTVSGISTEQGITVEALKYFSHNSDATSGYKAADYTSTSIDYATEFTTKTSGSLFSIDKISPGYRYTFAVEITCGFAYTRNITMNLATYTSVASSTNIYTATALATDSPYGIRLAEAMNVYGTSFIKGTTSAELTANNTIVKNFIYATETSLASTDGLNFTYGTADTTSSFSPGTKFAEADSPANGTTLVFLITLEFSNADTTFYANYPYSTSNGVNYYIHDTTGNSNVFKSLLTTNGFSIDDVSLIPVEKS